MATEQSTYRATNDAYTGMLTISLIAMIVGSAVLFLDYQQYPDQAPPKIPVKASQLLKPEAPPEKPPEAKQEEKKDDPTAEEKKE